LSRCLPFRGLKRKRWRSGDVYAIFRLLFPICEAFSDMLISLLRPLFNTYRRRTAFDLASLSRQFGFPVGGVLHVGANMGQEAEIYAQLGAQRVIWVEGFDKYFQTLKAHVASYSGQEAHCVLVSDKDGEEVKFRVASNTGSSTAMTPGADFARNFNGVVFDKVTTLRARRLDAYFDENSVTLDGINVLVLDVEGFELKVLRSMNSLMGAFGWAICEVSLVPNFEGGPLLKDIDDFFLANGYRRRALKCGITSGDGLYERNAASTTDRLSMSLSRAWATFAATSGIYRLKRAVGRL
jgi:FkbM family methyltransferase